MVKNDKTFSSSTWTKKSPTAQLSRAVPGGLDFTRYAASKGEGLLFPPIDGPDEELATRKNLEKLGFPTAAMSTRSDDARAAEWGSPRAADARYVARITEFCC